MDRKALIRRYKETVRPAGVFRVRNTTNGKSLVGSSTDVASMLNRQRAQLGFGGHPNRALQSDWNALGAHVFEFEILDTLTPPENQPDWDPSDDLAELEKLWLEKLSPYGERGYNLSPPKRG
jgi:hypothetical protein